METVEAGEEELKEETRKKEAPLLFFAWERCKRAR